MEEAKPAAERALSAAWGGPVRLEPVGELGGSDRSHVIRMTVAEAPSRAPAGVIVKQVAATNGEAYDPDAPGGPAWRLFNEWAALRFLTETVGDDSPAPRFYAGDRAAGLIVLEDLGSGVQLDHLLLGDDAEAAERGLVGLMVALGRMHAQTVGKGAAFEQLRAELGPRPDQPEPKAVLGEQRARLEPLLTLTGVTWATGAEAELDGLAAFISPEHPFAAFSHYDPCPDNCLLVDGEMRLLDFEFGGFRHALFDGVYGRIHFPTCWCVNRIPPDVVTRMERTYRAELAKGCPQAQDDAAFGRAVVEACAWWILFTSHPKLLEEDGRWGIATNRQRLLVRLDRFAEAAEAFGHLPGLAATARALAAALRARWPAEADAMPFYPAFR